MPLLGACMQQKSARIPAHCMRAGKMVKVDPYRVTIGGKQTYGCVNMADFLDALREKLKPNPTVTLRINPLPAQETYADIPRFPGGGHALAWMGMAPMGTVMCIAACSMQGFGYAERADLN